MIILRGLPGSGKSTWAKAYAYDQDGNATVCSADSYFMAGGRYCFDASKLGAAHAACRAMAIDAMREGAPTVLIDNTNITHAEYREYLEMADLYGYEVDIKVFPCDVETSLQRNTHGVPRSTIERMAKRWQP